MSSKLKRMRYILDEVLVHGVDGITSFVTGVKMKHMGTRIDTV